MNLRPEQTLAAKILAIVFGVGLLIVLAVGGVRSCQKLRSVEAQSKLDRAQSGAFENSAADAVNTQSAANARERDSEAVSRSNQEDIRNAKGADAAVDPAVRDAGFSGLCKRPSFRATKRGKLCGPPAP